MRYLGGKSKTAKRLAAIIGGGDRLIEPFCGGGAMTAALAPQFNTVEASDIHEDLILMWQAVQAGWEPPGDVSEAEYKALRDAPPSALRGVVGFCSWGGKWFGGCPRAENRSFFDETRRSILRDVKKVGNVTFSRRDYRDAHVREGDVVYCDPPYVNTTGYKAGKFDTSEFWRVAQGWVDGGATVFVSEMTAPENWRIALEIDIRRGVTGKAMVKERLYVLPRRRAVLNLEG